MNEELARWLTESVANGAEIWLDDEHRLHYRITIEQELAGLGGQIALRAADLRAFLRVAPNAVGPFDPSPAQLSIYIASRMNPGSTAHVLRYPRFIASEVDDQLLQECVAWLPRMHPMLAARFVELRGQPSLFFNLRPDAPLSIDRIGSDDPSIVRDWLARRSNTPTDPTSTRLFSVHAARIGASGSERLLLVLVAHHCIVDYISLEEVWRSLAHTHAELASGRAAPVRCDTLGLSDLARLPHWQSCRSTTMAARRAWADRLTCIPECAPILEVAHGRRSSGAGAEFLNVLDAAVVDGIEHFARLAGLTQFSVFFALHALLLLFKCGRPRLCVGLTTSGRTGHPVPRLVGCYVNSVPILLDASCLDEPLVDAVRAIDRQVRAAAAGECVPFVELVRMAPAARSVGRPTMFPTLFTWLDPGREDRSSERAEGSMQFAPFRTPEPMQVGVTHDIVTAVHRSKDDVVIAWSFDDGIHDLNDVQELAGDYERLIAVSVARPFAPVRESLQDQRERITI